MTHRDDIAARDVLKHYGTLCECCVLQHLGSAGGFSGSLLWKVVRPDGLGAFALRRWPAPFTADRIDEIHRVLLAILGRGITEIAVPLATARGQTFLHADGFYWELTKWMPGIANFRDQPTREKLNSAVRFLASFHNAAAALRPEVTEGPAFGIRLRSQQLQQLLSGGFDTIQRQFQARHAFNKSNQTVLEAALRTCGEQFLSTFPVLAPDISRQLQQAMHWKVSTIPCIRDLWHDHLLFTGEQVTGVVDFGSLRPDHVASDLSRLLGSLLQGNYAEWKRAIGEYEKEHPLSPRDRELISIYDRSGVLLGAMNWLQWLYVDGRLFPEPSRVIERCQELSARMVQIATTTLRWE
jgi:Ser/Thr protein kinase RdoA (MazF antagonist)